MQNSIIEGDCQQVLKQLPNNSVDLVLTDPPYFVRYKDRDGRTVANDDRPDSVLGAFFDIYRVMKPNSVCVSFYGWSKVHAFFDYWLRAGLHPVGHIVWCKDYASRKGVLNARHEMAYVLSKGEPPRPNRNLDDVRMWEYTGNVLHPTQKAVSVFRPLVEAFSQKDGVVLDPFCGSGSTLVAAALAGRKYVGIELTAQNCETARHRLERVNRFMMLEQSA